MSFNPLKIVPSYYPRCVREGMSLTAKFRRSSVVSCSNIYNAQSCTFHTLKLQKGPMRLMCELPMREFSMNGACESDESAYRDPFFTSSSQPRPKVVVLSGGTAVGKTSTSIHIAKSQNGEIISADSVQIFSGIDIGSAKVGIEETEGVPHYLIDQCPVGAQDSNASQFYACALTLVKDIISRGKTPIIVGGTSMYTRWLQYGKPGEITTTHDPVLKSSIMKVFVENVVQSKNASDMVNAMVKRPEVLDHDIQSRKQACKNISRITQHVESSEEFALTSLIQDEMAQIWANTPRYTQQYNHSVEKIEAIVQPCFDTLLKSFQYKMPVDDVTYSGLTDIDTVTQESLQYKYNSPIHREETSREEYVHFAKGLYMVYLEEILQVQLERCLAWSKAQGVTTSVDYQVQQTETDIAHLFCKSSSVYRPVVREYIRSEPSPTGALLSFADIFYPESTLVNESSHAAHTEAIRPALERFYKGELGYTTRPNGAVVYSVVHPSLPVEPVYISIPLNPNENMYVALGQTTVPTTPKPTTCTQSVAACLGQLWKLAQIDVSSNVLAWTDSIQFQNDLYRFEKRILHVFTAPEGLEPQVPKQYNDKLDEELITRLKQNEGPAPLDVNDLSVSHAGRGLVHDFDVRVFFLCTSRNFHYRLADFRCEEMMRRGMLKETLLLTNTLTNGYMNEDPVGKDHQSDLVHPSSVQQGLEAARLRVLPTYQSLYTDVVAQFARDFAPIVAGLLALAQSRPKEAQECFSLLRHLRTCLQENLLVAQSQQAPLSHSPGSRGIIKGMNAGSEPTDNQWSTTALQYALECVTSLEEGLAVSMSQETVIQLACPSPLIYRTKVRRLGDATLYTENPAAYLSIHWFERSMILRGYGLQSSRGDEVTSTELNPLLYGAGMPCVIAEQEVQAMIPYISGDVALWLQICMSVRGVHLPRQKFSLLLERPNTANTMNNIDIGLGSPTMSLFLESKEQQDCLPKTREIEATEPVQPSIRLNKYIIGEKIKSIGEEYTQSKARRSIHKYTQGSHTNIAKNGGGFEFGKEVTEKLASQAENQHVYTEHQQSQETPISKLASSITTSHDRSLRTFRSSSNEVEVGNPGVINTSRSSFTPVFATAGTELRPNDTILLPKVPLKQQQLCDVVYSTQPLPFQVQESLPAYPLPTVMTAETPQLAGFTARFPAFIPTNSLAHSFNDGRQQYAIQEAHHVKFEKPVHDYRVLTGNIQNIPVVPEQSPHTVTISPSLRTEALDDCAMPASSVRGRSIGYADILKWQKELKLDSLMAQWSELTNTVAFQREQYVSVSTASTKTPYHGVVGNNAGLGILANEKGKVTGSLFPWESEVVMRSTLGLEQDPSRLQKLRNMLLQYVESKKQQLMKLGGIVEQENDTAVTLPPVGVLSKEVETLMDDMELFDKATLGMLLDDWNTKTSAVNLRQLEKVESLPSEYPTTLLVDAYAPNAVKTGKPSIDNVLPHAAVLASNVRTNGIVQSDNIVMKIPATEVEGIPEQEVPVRSQQPSFTHENAKARLTQVQKQVQWLHNQQKAVAKQVSKERLVHVVSNELLTLPPSTVKSGQFYAKSDVSSAYYTGKARGASTASVIGEYQHELSGVIVQQAQLDSIKATNNPIFYNPDYIAGQVDVRTPQITQGELLAKDVQNKLVDKPIITGASVTRALIHAFNTPTTIDKTVSNGLTQDSVGITHPHKKAVDALLAGSLALNYRHSFQPYRKQLGLFPVQELRGIFTPELIKSFSEVQKCMQNSTRNFIRKQYQYMRDDPQCQFVQVPTSNIYPFASTSASDLLVLRAIQNAIENVSTSQHKKSPVTQSLDTFPRSRPFFTPKEAQDSDTSGYPVVPDVDTIFAQKQVLSSRVEQIQDNINMLNALLIYKDRSTLPNVDWGAANRVELNTKKAMFAHHHQDTAVDFPMVPDREGVANVIISSNTDGNKTFRDIVNARKAVDNAAKAAKIVKSMQGDLTYGREALTDTERTVFDLFQKEVTDPAVMQKVVAIEKQNMPVKEKRTSRRRRGGKKPMEDTSDILEKMDIHPKQATNTEDTSLSMDFATLDLDAYLDNLLEANTMLGSGSAESVFQQPAHTQDTVHTEYNTSYGVNGVVLPSTKQQYSTTYDEVIKATIHNQVTDSTVEELDKKSVQQLHGKQYTTLRKLLSVRETVPLLYSFGVHNDALHTYGSVGYTEPAHVKHQIQLPAEFRELTAFASPTYSAKETPEQEQQFIYQQNAAKIYKSNLQNVAQYIVSQVHMSQRDYWSNFNSQEMRDTQSQMIAENNVTSATYQPHNVLFTHDGPIVETLAEYIDYAVQMHNRDNQFNWYDKETTPDEWMVPSRTTLQHTQPVSHPFITAKHLY